MVDFGCARMIEVGTVLEEHTFYLDRAMLKAYADASGDQNPIHQNEEFALSVGLPNVIAHGMLTMADQLLLKSFQPAL
jgi:acyl dehydratase